MPRKLFHDQHGLHVSSRLHHREYVKQHHILSSLRYLQIIHAVYFQFLTLGHAHQSRVVKTVSAFERLWTTSVCVWTTSQELTVMCLSIRAIEASISTAQHAKLSMPGTSRAAVVRDGLDASASLKSVNILN